MDEAQFNIGLAVAQREAAAGRGIPPVERWRPSHCGDIDIRIARNGTWYHQGAPIVRREIVRLFSTILRKDLDGYCLVTPLEKMRIRVDDVPFLAVLLDVKECGHEQELVFTTNVGDVVSAGAGNPIRVTTDPATGEPAPYIRVRADLDARIARPVFYQLADLAVAGVGEDMLGVWSHGTFFDLGPAE
jgi:hypothetical protein